MAQIATTTQADPLGVPANTRLDRDPQTGYLYALVKSTTANTWDLYRSTNGGTIWTLHLSLLRTGVQEMGSTFIANDGHLYLSYRTNEGGQDRIYFRRCRLENPVWGPETLTGQPAHGGTPGAIHQGMDIQLVQTSRWMYVVIVVGTTFGSTSGITLYGVLVDHPAGTHVYSNRFLTGRRQWMDITGTHRIVPSVDIEHDGSGKSSAVPHLWISYGRDVLRTVKLSWTGGGWSGPPTTQLLQTGLPAQDGITGRWDGSRWLMVVPHPTATDTVQIVERDRGNSKTEVRQSPAHPAGVVRSVGLSYSRATGRNATEVTRVYAVGTANPDLHFVDYIRASATWTSWTTVSTTDVLGTPPAQWSVRRGAAAAPPTGSGQAAVADARHTVAIAHPPSPNAVVSYHQTVAYSPDTPTWDVPAIGVDNGAAAEVSSALTLDWVYSDPDPGDAQSAWALSRQIGTGTIEYLRASDSTWQLAEQKNAGATSARTLAAGWGLTSDAAHSYRVRVWDGSDTASLYSDAFVVLPSGKVNPAITAPTAGQVLDRDTVTVAWAVAEQTAFRVRLLILAEVVFDSGWVAGTATSYTPDFALGDNFGYTVALQTRNLKGLVSDEQTRNFTVDFIEPATATLVTTPLPASGVIRVAVTNPPPVGSQPAVAGVDLYRRPITQPFIIEHDFEVDTARFADTFNRTVSNSWGGGWTSVGGSASDYAVNGTKATHTHTNRGVDRANRLDAMPPTSDVDIYLRGVTLSAAPAGANDEIGIRSSYNTATPTSYNEFRLFWNASGGAVTINVDQRVSGSVAFISGFPTIAGASNATPLDVHYQVRGNIIRARAWLSSNAEPTTWNVTITTTVINPPGIAYVRSLAAGAGTGALPIIFSFDGVELDSPPAGWGPEQAGYALRSNTRAHKGSWSYQLTADGTDPLGAHVETVKLPCTPNAVQFLDMWIAGSSTSKETFAQIRWYNAAGTQVGVDNGIKKPAPAVNAWDYRWCRATAPSDATQMTLHAVIGLPSAGDTIWVDEVRARVNDPNEGVRVAQGLPSGATYDDWGAVSGVPYEYRAQTRSVIGTTVGGVWTA